MTTWTSTIQFGSLSWTCHSVTRFFSCFFNESNPLGPQINRLKRFCWKTHFCEDIRILSSTIWLCAVLFCMELKNLISKSIKTFKTILIHVKIVNMYFFKFDYNILFQGKERPAKDKMCIGKTPCNVSLCGVRLRAMLAGIIGKFSRDHWQV